MDVQNQFSDIYIRKTIIVKEGKYMTKEKKCSLMGVTKLRF